MFTCLVCSALHRIKTWSNHDILGENTDFIAAINTCSASPPPCDEHAECVYEGPARYHCYCVNGYQGDGVYCEPINPCQEENGGCDQETSFCSYLAPNQVIINIDIKYML